MTPECSFGEHDWCRGPAVIRRRGAPSWEVPILTVTCTCRCHGASATPTPTKKDGRR